MVPSERSTGGKQKLLGVSKRGHSYLRRLLRARGPCRSAAEREIIFRSAGVAGSPHFAHPSQPCGSGFSQSVGLHNLGGAWPNSKDIGHPPWPVRPIANWPAADAWRTPGLEIASRFPHLQTSGDYGLNNFLPGLLAIAEMAQGSNPALSKPVIRKSPSRLPN